MTVLYEPNSPIVEAKLKIVNEEFRRDSKGNIAARQIVQWREELSKEDINVLINEIPIKAKTLEGVFTRLRKLKLYPPQEFSLPSTPKEPQVTSHPVPKVSQPSSEYATKEDFETLRDSINYLASVMSGVDPESLGEDEEEEKEVEDIQPEEVELIQPEEIIIEETSLIRHTVFFKPKTLEFFDLVLQGGRVSDEVTLDLGPFTNFKGNLSDFCNDTVNLCFNIILNLNVGFLPYVRDMVVS